MQHLICHPVTPQKPLISKVVQALIQDKIIIYPTDSGYSMGCSAHSKKAIKRIYQIKKPSKKYSMALMFQHFSPISEFAHLDNHAFKFMKHLVPGPFTFILPATNKGRKLLEVKRAEMGVRFPDHPFLSALYPEFPDPIITTSARVSDEDITAEPNEIEQLFSSKVDMLIDCGSLYHNPTTVVSLLSGEPELVRQGAGKIPGW